MKILQVAFFCLFTAGCTAAPKLEFPTGNKSVRQPINVLQPILSETAPLEAAPAGKNPDIDGILPLDKSTNTTTWNDS